MLQFIFSIPFLGLLVVIQSAVVSRMKLLNGSADLMLLALAALAVQNNFRRAWLWALVGGLAASLVSALPFGILLGGYLAATGLALLLKRWLNKAPMLAVLIVVFAGTLIIQAASYLAVVLLLGGLLPLGQVINTITLPSLLLNLLLSFPLFLVLRDLADWLYPQELKV